MSFTSILFVIIHTPFVRIWAMTPDLFIHIAPFFGKLPLSWLCADAFFTRNSTFLWGKIITRFVIKKSLTMDFPTGKRKKNERQLDVYLLENGFEQIITEEPLKIHAKK